MLNRNLLFVLALVFSCSASAGPIILDYDFNDASHADYFNDHGQHVSSKWHNKSLLELRVETARRADLLEIDLDSYVSWNVSVADGLLLDFLSFKVRQTGASREGNLVIRSSLDNFESNLFEELIAGPENRKHGGNLKVIDLTDLHKDFQSQTGPALLSTQASGGEEIEFRFYVYDEFERTMQTRIVVNDMIVQTVPEPKSWMLVLIALLMFSSRFMLKQR